jgi:RimJ/RimL family protein N-acetyltransferase
MLIALRSSRRANRASFVRKPAIARSEREGLMHLLEPSARERLFPLCEGLDAHAAVGAILRGAATGDVFVDDVARPRSALLRVKRRLFLAGVADNDRFTEGVKAWFGEYLYPTAAREGTVEWWLCHDGEPWETTIATMVGERHPIRDDSVCYEFTARRAPTELPAGMSVRAVDQALLAQGALRNLDALREEMCSERHTVDEFLAKSHGVCIARADPAGDELVSWCLSEYDHDARCEIGIETVADYRRCGHSRQAATALVERLLARGTTRIGWHCWRQNVASRATAQRAGFTWVGEYPAYLDWFDEAANLAVNGMARLRNGDPSAALAWFARAMAMAQAPNWAWFGAARAAAALGRVDEARELLSGAVARGFDDGDAFCGAAELCVLHDSEGWRRLMGQIGAA